MAAPGSSPGTANTLEPSRVQDSISRAFFCVWGADVRELLQNVVMRLEARRRALVFRQEGEPVIDHVVGEDPAVGFGRGLRRLETQAVRKRALRIDGGDGFLARVIAGVTHEMDELLEPPVAVVDGLAGVIFQFGVVRVEEAADARMAGAIDVNQSAVLS